MTSYQIEIQLIAVTVAAACALPGVFLVLRRTAMLSDAISHAILFGIVVAFFVTGDLSSPLLVFGAAATGLLTVVLVEMLTATRLVREDAAIGLTFPVLFSLGVLLIARYAGSVHLDVDTVLLGEIAFTPFRRATLGGVDLGPRALWVMLGILAVSATLILLFYKELKLATFDPALAAALGISPALVHYTLMGVVSFTAVGAFDAVGSVLVVALMIAPPAAAYLWTDRLSTMMGASVLLAVLSAIGGYWLAHLFDVSIAGSMAVTAGGMFLLAYLFAPERGLIAAARRRQRQRWEFAEAMLAIHLHQHEGHPEAEIECREDHLRDHVSWPAGFARSVVDRAERHGTVTRVDGVLRLTGTGRELARQALVR